MKTFLIFLCLSVSTAVFAHSTTVVKTPGTPTKVLVTHPDPLIIKHKRAHHPVVIKKHKVIHTTPVILKNKNCPKLKGKNKHC